MMRFGLTFVCLSLVFESTLCFILRDFKFAVSNHVSKSFVWKFDWKLRISSASDDNLPEYLKDLDDIMWDDEVDGDFDEENAYMDLPTGNFLGDMAYNPKRDDGGLGSVKLKDISSDYDFPIEFILDVLCRWGVSPPINEDEKLGSLVNGEQAFAIAEALTSIDPAIIHDFYLNESLEELSEQLDIPLSDIFLVCGKRRFSLPLGAETHLTMSDYNTLLKDLGMGDMVEDERKVDAFMKGTENTFMADMFSGNPEDMVLSDGMTTVVPTPKVKPFII
mmetsp:Transcript_17936/g.26570  ORF Transcript_17936/g.26570 Transcript_17936/m.26570 type:complete len:277 (-) Transcript_17936:9-839(-)